jgi:hypothetical protein
MKKIIFVLMVVMLGLSLVGHGNADIIYNFSDVFNFDNKPFPVGPAPWLTATFSNIGDSGDVKLTLAANLQSSQFVRDWYFNLNPEFDSTELTITRNTPDGGNAPIASTSTGNNLQKADGDGFYDLLFEFPTAEGSTFNGTETAIFTLSLSSGNILEDDFSYKSVGSNSGYSAAAHIQGIPITGSTETDSTWVVPGGEGVSNVPIPPTVFLLGAGLIGLVGLRRKFRK